MHRDADDTRLVRDGPLDRLLDPPIGVGRELVAALVLELLDGLHQPDVAFLDQVHEGYAVIEVLLGDVHDEAQVRQDQRVPRMIDMALASLGLARESGQLRVLRKLLLVAHEPGMELFHVVQRPFATPLRTRRVVAEHVRAHGGRDPPPDLGDTLAGLLQFAGQLDLLVLVDQRRRTHLAQVDRQDGRGRLRDVRLVTRLAAALAAQHRVDHGRRPLIRRGCVFVETDLVLKYHLASHGVRSPLSRRLPQPV